MFRSLAFFIGLRYVFTKRKNHFISFISISSMIGLLLGVSVLIVVLSVMNGFDHELQYRILGMVPQATVTHDNQPIDNWRELIDKIDQNKQVIASAPFINIQGMLTSHSGGIRGSYIYGILPKYEGKISIINRFMTQGSLQQLTPGHFGIVLGGLLADALGVTVGDQITLVLPQASVNLAGVFPRFKQFTVVGIFNAGAQIDGTLAYINMQDAARLQRVKLNSALGIRIQFKNLFQAPTLVKNIVYEKLHLPLSYETNNWTETQGQLFSAIQMEKTMVGLLLMLIIAVAAFNIVSTLVMAVTDKKSDIAILRTIGASKSTIMAIFIVQGTIIGLIGTILGTLFGVIVALNLPAIMNWIQHLLNVQFLNPNVYSISYLPSLVKIKDIVIISSSAFLMSFIATIYPAWRASRINPVEALKYE